MRPEHPDKRKMLPLKHQQAAFETVYLKAQEGMRLPVSSSDVNYLIMCVCILPLFFTVLILLVSV